MTRTEAMSVLDEVKTRLSGLYGPRLRGVVFYGSEARGEAQPDSDLDFLVLLDGPIRFGKELEAIIEALYPLVLDLGRSIHAIPVDFAVYEAGEYALYRNAKREGVVR
jgi:uncharacterized protein